MSIWGYRSMYNEMINSAFGAEDFHLSVFKQEDGWKRRYSGELEQCDLRHRSMKFCLICAEWRVIRRPETVKF